MPFAAAITSGRGCGLAMPTALRSGSDEITADGSKTLSPTCTRTQRSSSKSSWVTLWLEEHLAAELLDVVGHRLPHLAGAVAGVVELRDQARDLVVLVAEERGPGGAEEREVLDPLRGPVGADLGRRDAPDLLGVGLEELVEEPAAEAVGHPLLVGVLLALRLDRRPEVGEERLGQVDRAELLHHVRAAQRVVEELRAALAVAPVDARHPRALEELLAHDLVPEVVDLLHLREEAVAAEVEAVAVAHRGLRDAAHLVLGLEHDHRQALLGEQVARGQAGGAGAEDHGRLLGHVRAGRGWLGAVASCCSRSSGLLVDHATDSDARGAAVAERARPSLARAAGRSQAPRPTGRRGA